MSMFESNPQLRAIMEANPQMRHVLRDPSTMRQMMNVMRNPELYQQMLRNQDRQLRNIESMPGGMSALENMYRDVQRPLEDALGRRQSTDETNVPELDTETGPRADPIPNPWRQNNANANNA